MLWPRVYQVCAPGLCSCGACSYQRAYSAPLKVVARFAVAPVWGMVLLGSFAAYTALLRSWQRCGFAVQVLAARVRSPADQTSFAGERQKARNSMFSLRETLARLQGVTSA